MNKRIFHVANFPRENISRRLMHKVELEKSIQSLLRGVYTSILNYKFCNQSGENRIWNKYEGNIDFSSIIVKFSYEVGGDVL